MFLKLCMSVIFYGKKQKRFAFMLIKKFSFPLNCYTQFSNRKGQDSNCKGQMSHPFCPLRLPLSVLVTVKDGNGKGQNASNLSI